ncbi:hypothetical protein [Leifsonia sp. Le1]|uniref:hypothetical protein n=1 Tax=Leifsonia sp. Le1 TaxID=3404918 RepID=UPI003EB75AC1
MPAREGRDIVVNFVFDTIEQLDVTGWVAYPAAAYAQECKLPGGEMGAAYSHARWAPAGTDPIDDARRISDYWESLGMYVYTVNADTTPRVYGRGGPVLRASFDTDAAKHSYRIGAIMPCGPGDAITLNGEDIAKQEQGVILPGDDEGESNETRYWMTTPTPQPSDQ